MIESMIERVAMALAKSLTGEDWSEIEYGRSFEGSTRLFKDEYRDLARAAIAAIREPTDAMRRVEGINEIGSLERLDGYLDAFSAKGGWPAMIDAALAENTQPLADKIEENGE